MNVGKKIPAIKSIPWEKISFRRSSGCWEWHGANDANGYGRLYIAPKYYLAHRVMYEKMRDRIPFGMVIDHLCRNTCCVNPKHLEVVTLKENNLRGESLFAKRARKKRCIRGHLLSGDVLDKRLLKERGWRVCTRCKLIVNRKLKAKKKIYG